MKSSLIYIFCSGSGEGTTSLIIIHSIRPFLAHSFPLKQWIVKRTTEIYLCNGRKSLNPWNASLKSFSRPCGPAGAFGGREAGPRWRKSHSSSLYSASTPARWGQLPTVHPLPPPPPPLPPLLPPLPPLVSLEGWPASCLPLVSIGQ